MFAYPKAEIVIPPCIAVLLHCPGGGGVAQVMVPTDKYQWDGGICALQGSLQVSLLTLSEWGVWVGKGELLVKCESRLDVLVPN